MFNLKLWNFIYNSYFGLYRNIMYLDLLKKELDKFKDNDNWSNMGF